MEPLSMETTSRRQGHPNSSTVTRGTGSQQVDSPQQPHPQMSCELCHGGTRNTERENPGIRHSLWSPLWQHLVQERHTPDHIQLQWPLNQNRQHTQGLECPEERRHDDRDQERKTACIDAKRMAKHAVWLAKSKAEKEEFATVSPDGDGISVSPNRWTAEIRALLVRTVYAMMLVSLHSLTKTR